MSESKLQQGCVKWFRYQYPQWRLFLLAIPNGAFLNGTAKQRILQWKKLRREGAVEGAPDLVLFDPYGKKLPLLIEMKLPKGVQSPNQVEFERTYSDAGYSYKVVRGFDEFEGVVNEYLIG